jgi:transposase
LPPGQGRGLGAGLRASGRRRRGRARDDRRHRRARPPAQRRGGQQSGGGDEAIGRGRGGPSAKIHATVDAPGGPTGLAPSPGQAHDLEGAGALLPGSAADAPIADEAFDAGERVLRPLARAGKAAVIPPEASRRNPRPYDRDLYEARHLIESFFARLKQYRAIATRRDKRAVPFLGAIHLAAAVIPNPADRFRMAPSG